MKRPRKYDRPRTAVAWMAAILLVTGCAGGNRDVLDAEPDQITDDLHPADVDAPEVVPDDGAGQDPGNARPDEGESGDDYGNGSNCYEFFCDYSDFACLDEGTYTPASSTRTRKGPVLHRPCGLPTTKMPGGNPLLLKGKKRLRGWLDAQRPTALPADGLRRGIRKIL